jgi:hypothetical protein
VNEAAAEKPPPSAPGATTALVAALLAGWLAVKVRLFLGLEYTSDLFAWIQLPRNWLQGRPFFYASGPPSAVVHGYYLSPLLGPLTNAWGAYGLFAVHAALLLAAFRAADRLIAPDFGRRVAFALAYLFGPIAFWIWDDPTYGWHIELLYLPLAVLFVAALCRGSRARWAWAAALVLLREDGAVLACSLELVRTWGRQDAPPWSRRGLGATLRIALVWLAVFAAGFAWLRFTQPELEGRFGRAVHFMAASLPGARSALALSAVWALLLFLSGLVLATPRRAALALLGAVPLLVVAVVASGYYGSAQGIALHGPTWPPRFVMLWSVLGAALLVPAGETEKGPPGLARSRRGVAIAIAASLIAQLALLSAVRGYSPLQRFATALPGSGDLLSARLSAAERSFLGCLRERLPRDTTVAAHGSLFAYFHRHDLVHPQFVAHAWRPPAVVVCETEDRLPWEDDCRSVRKTMLEAGFERAGVEGIKVAAAPDRAGIVRGCAAESPR